LTSAHRTSFGALARVDPAAARRMTAWG